jgi:hypothetical protein
MLGHSVTKNSLIFPIPTAFLHSLVIVLVAAILCTPCLLVGIPAGVDSSIHVTYQYSFSHQFWNGDLYPRWLADANKGFGSPIFFIQFPLPYFATALLRPIMSFPPTATREAHELGVYCFLTLAAAGLAARAWFRHRCSPVASSLAAIAYISFPYILGQALYYRMALGELSTFVWMPAALALCDRALLRRYGVLSALGVVFALLVLSNALTGLLFIPVILLYVIVSERPADMSFVKRIAPVLLALALGIGVAAIYVFPLVAYQRLFDLNRLVTNHPYTELGRSLLFVSARDMFANQIAVPGMISAICLTLIVARYVWRADVTFVSRLGMLLTLGLGVAMVIPDLGPRVIEWSRLKVSGFDTCCGGLSMRMLFSALITIALGILAFCRVAGVDTNRRECVLLVISCGAFVLMLPWSAALWKAIPGLAVIEFPWRLSGILTVTTAGLFAVALDDCLRGRVGGERKPSPIAISVVALAVVGCGALIWRVDAPLRTLDTRRVDLMREVDSMYPTYVSPLNLAAFAKSLGTSPDSWDVAPTPLEDGVRAEFTEGQGTVSVIPVGPRKLRISAQSLGDSRIRIGQMYWPLWRIVTVTQSPPDEALRSSPEGLIEVSLAPGRHDFELVLDGGLPERSGAIVTLMSVLFVVGAFTFAGLSNMGRVTVKAVDDGGTIPPPRSRSC